MADLKETIKAGDKLYSPGIGIVKVIKSGQDTDYIVFINGHLSISCSGGQVKDSNEIYDKLKAKGRKF